MIWTYIRFNEVNALRNIFEKINSQVLTWIKYTLTKTNYKIKNSEHSKVKKLKIEEILLNQ
jgi:predicted nucleotide-binding protein (sugar kinase/HSP70/actin superfamily)